MASRRLKRDGKCHTCRESGFKKLLCLPYSPVGGVDAVNVQANSSWQDKPAVLTVAGCAFVLSEESIASERATWTAEVDAMRGTIATSTKALGDELAASIDTFHTRCSAAEADISSSSAELSSAVATLTASIAAEQEERRAALTKLQAATEASAAALEKSTTSKLDESAAEIDSACARMNAEIAQTAEDVLAIRTVMDAKIEQECETLEASLQRVNRTFSEQLSSFQEDINGQVLVRLDDFDGKLAGMVARLAPCENKLLEVALRAEVKSQSMLIDMRVAEVSRSAPPLGPLAKTCRIELCLSGRREPVA